MSANCLKNSNRAIKSKNKTWAGSITPYPRSRLALITSSIATQTNTRQGERTTAEHSHPVIRAGLREAVPGQDNRQVLKSSISADATHAKGNASVIHQPGN